MEVKNGHDRIKEYHFHVYWFQANPNQGKSVLYASLRYSTLLYTTLRYSTLLYTTLRYSTLRYATLRYATLRYATLRYSTLLYATKLSYPGYTIYSDAEKEAVDFREALIQEVKANKLTVVCPGIGPNEVPKFTSRPARVNKGPIGPHPCGSYEIWTPEESLSSMMSFAMMNRGSLSILIHPLGRNEVQSYFIEELRKNVVQGVP
jgi:hypothetical protein